MTDDAQTSALAQAWAEGASSGLRYAASRTSDSRIWLERWACRFEPTTDGQTTICGDLDEQLNPYRDGPAASQVTDEMVETMCREWYRRIMSRLGTWDTLEPEIQARWRGWARSVLEVVLR